MGETKTKNKKKEGSCATIAMRQEGKIPVTFPTKSKDGEESSWQKKKRKKRRATRRCTRRETRRYEKMGNWRRRKCATKRKRCRRSWAPYRMQIHRGLLEYSPTNDGQYSFLPSFLPSPDQRVELFSPVLGGSLFLARTWNRRG